MKDGGEHSRDCSSCGSCFETSRANLRATAGDLLGSFDGYKGTDIVRLFGNVFIFDHGVEDYAKAMLWNLFVGRLSGAHMSHQQDVYSIYGTQRSQRHRI